VSPLCTLPLGFLLRIRAAIEKRWTARSDNDIDDGDNDEHVCSGHYHCTIARADKRLDRTGSSDSGPVTTMVDDLAASLAKLRAGETGAAK
jgi:hypothetical protein